MAQPLHVLVIGGGLAGLAIAHGLRKNNISCLVIEKDLPLRISNWGVTISWSHANLARLIPDDLFRQLSICQPDPTLDAKRRGCEGVRIRDGRTGEILVEPHFPGTMRLNIQKTKKLWSKDLNVEYRKRLVDIDDSSPDEAVAYFADGTREAATVIVGADGSGSFVREWLLGDLAESETLPYVFMNFHVQYTAEQALFIQERMHPLVDVGIHPKEMYLGLFLLDKPELDRPETWTFYILASWQRETKDDAKDSSENRLERLRGKMDDWAEPFRSAVAWVPGDTRIMPNALRMWAPKEWDNRAGRVTLAGDAAHTMTFYRGQGANNAFCDSTRFVDAMISVQSGSKSLSEAVGEYDRDVLERGQKEVELSYLMTLAAHDYENYLRSPIMTYGIKQPTGLKA